MKVAGNKDKMIANPAQKKKSQKSGRWKKTSHSIIRVSSFFSTSLKYREAWSRIR